MIETFIQTNRLILRANSLEEVRAWIEAMSPAEKVLLSPDWLSRLRASNGTDPWTHGFSVSRREDGLSVGHAGFTGPPAADGTVEIAYGIFPDHQGRGYATEVAEALTAFAFNDSRVAMVWAHTMPDPNASTRVLTKCGFRRVGEIVDPEDGLVWRWQKSQVPA